MQVLIEVFPKARRIVLIGAGHVNQGVLKLVREMGWRCVVADDRPKYATAKRLGETVEIHSAQTIEAAVRQSNIQTTDICVIATANSDLEALREVVKQNPIYVGMIGSRRKVQKIFQILASEGVSQKTLDGVHAPVGLDIGANTPFEIGISIVGEIIAHLNGATGEMMKIGEKAK